MARWVGLALALAIVAGSGGCAGTPDSERRTSFLHRFRPDQTFEGLDAVQLDVALLECPLGDAFINRELWKSTDEMIVDPERRIALEQNGLRVGQIVSMTPGALQDLLKNERASVNPRRRLLPAGQTVTQYLGPPLSATHFTLHQDERRQDIDLDQARFGLEVTPHLADGGKTRLVFTPKVEHGEVTLPFHPDPQRSTWTLRVEKPARTFPELGWEITLAPNKLLVIGARPHIEDSLGHRALVSAEEGRPVQRLLVIRASHSRGPDAGQPTLEDIARSAVSPPLAVQATMTAVRGRSP